MFAEVNGVRLWYEAHGEGEPVLLLSGFGACCGYWKRILPLMEGCRCIMVDNRGIGKTECTGPFGIHDLADDAVALMESLGYKRFRAIGWSMGSTILLSMSSRYPERVASQVLVSTYKDRPARTSYVLGEFTRMLNEGGASLEAFYVMVNAFCFSERFFRRFADNGTCVPLPKDSESPEGLLRQIHAVDGFDPWDGFSEIEVPTLVVQGTEDIMTPFEQGRLVSEAIPGAQLLAIEGEGHNIDQKLYADQAREFLFSHRWERR